MLFTLGQSAGAWPTRRTQRCISFALIFTIILIVGLYERQSWPQEPRPQSNSRRGLHIYGSTPEAGRPSRPLRNRNAHVLHYS